MQGKDALPTMQGKDALPTIQGKDALPTLGGDEIAQIRPSSATRRLFDRFSIEEVRR
jgi:hypothetical protein